MAKTNWLILVALLAILASSLATAQNIEVGRVLMATLGVTANQVDSESRTLARRSSIFLGDTIKTPEGGKAQVRMADGEMISLMESSELLIEDFKFQPEAKDENNASVKNLVTGGLRVITGAVKGDGYELKSRAGTIGIRGTAFEVFTQQGQNLFLRMQNGRVFVQNQQGGVEVAANQALSAVQISGVNQAPQAIPPAQLPAFFERTFAQNTNLSLAGENPVQQETQEEQQEEDSAPQQIAQTQRSAPEQNLPIEQATNQNTFVAGFQLPILQEDFEDLAKNSAAIPDPIPIAPSAGPFGYIVGLNDTNGNYYASQFMGSPISIARSDQTEVLGDGGEGILGLGVVNEFHYMEYEFYLQSGFLTLGDAEITLVNADGINKLIHINSSHEEIENGVMVSSTNIHNTIDSLPSVGDYQYNLISSQAGGYTGGLSSGSLNVNFATGNIIVQLNTISQLSYSGSGSVNSFYNNSINLVNESGGYNYQGLITGRFVGSNVEGAITAYKLNGPQIDPLVGIGIFDRTNSYPQGIPTP